MTKSEDDWTLRELEVTKNRFGSAAQVAFRMTDNGFTFEAEEMEKESRPTSKKDLILEALKEPSTVSDLLNNLDISKVYLNNLLKEMSERGIVSKKGKGSEAIYSLKEKE
jgi:predicted transcriptional regulator